MCFQLKEIVEISLMHVLRNYNIFGWVIKLDVWVVQHCTESKIGEPGSNLWLIGGVHIWANTLVKGMNLLVSISNII